MLSKLLVISNRNLRAKHVSGLSSIINEIWDDILKLSPAGGLVRCARDPHAFYRLRSMLEHGFSDDLPDQEAISMFKFLDSDFMLD
jgi:hypothetical protein